MIKLNKKSNRKLKIHYKNKTEKMKKYNNNTNNKDPAIYQSLNTVCLLNKIFKHLLFKYQKKMIINIIKIIIIIIIVDLVVQMVTNLE